MGERKYRVGAHLIVAAALLTACSSVHAGTVGLDTGPDGPVVSWFVDADGDGFGDPDQPREGAAVPADGSRLGTDCDDSDIRERRSGCARGGGPSRWTSTRT